MNFREHDKESVCPKNNTVRCPELTKPENIIGIQGQIWSEGMRNSDMLVSNTFPRLIALAEVALRERDFESIVAI